MARVTLFHGNKIFETIVLNDMLHSKCNAMPCNAMAGEEEAQMNKEV